MKDTPKSQIISTELQQIAEQAIQYPERVFISLVHKVDINFLREAFCRLRKDAAPGLSGKTLKEYGKALDLNLQKLHGRLKGRTYKAQPIKRVWIEKEGGKKRPIGLLEIEDKIVQKAISMLLGAIYEQDFYSFSYGFRERMNAHQALGEIRNQCMSNGIKWIVDADISGFFDNIDRGLLIAFIKQRVKDGGILRLIGKWLNVGVVEEEQITYSEKGTPQGGTISPILANIFLHYVLDEWFVKEVQPRLKGYSFIARFADDFVIGCQNKEDADKIMEVLPKRFGKYKLEIHPEKSSLISFERPGYGTLSGKESSTFDFLGYTHYWAKTRRGYWVIKRKTARKKVKKMNQSVWNWCKQNRHTEILTQFRILSSKLRGHYQYFGVRCNTRSMEKVYYNAIRAWQYWLSRRSSRKSMDWIKYKGLLSKLVLPKPRIIHDF